MPGFYEIRTHLHAIAALEKRKMHTIVHNRAYSLAYVRTHMCVFVYVCKLSAGEGTNKHHDWTD